MADFKTTTPAELREQMLQDFELGSIELGLTAPTGKGSEWDLLATGESQLHSFYLENLSLYGQGLTPWTATGDALENWRRSLGLPERLPVGATGSIIIETTAPVSLVDGDECTIGQWRYGVIGSWPNQSNYALVPVRCKDTGVETDQPAGAVGAWTNPGKNLKSRVTVSTAEPLSGGRGVESDGEKRDRCLGAARYAPGGGNWADLRRIAMDTSPGIWGAYVYPALGGPSSSQVALVKSPEPTINDWSRVPPQSLVDSVRRNIQLLVPEGVEIPVLAVAEELATVAISIEIPPSTSSGGDGTGWIDAVPSPTSGGQGCVVWQVTNSSSIGCYGAPPVGAHIAWWCSAEQRFYRAIVTWVHPSVTFPGRPFTTDRPLVSESGVVVATGDFISPDCYNIEAYGNTWRDIFGSLGPGENTADPNRLPRASRRPKISAQDTPTIAGTHKRAFLNAHSEVVDVNYLNLTPNNGTPTVPATVDLPPNVLRLSQLGIYPV